MYSIQTVIQYGIVIYFRGISGFSQDVTSSVKGHHVLLTTRAITNHKDFSKMQRLLVNFDFIHYSYQILN
jgi:hypothetical protein